MKILGISDIHGRNTELSHIISEAGQVDLVLLAGDITNFGSPDTAEHLVHIAQSGNTTVLAVAGNCDSALIDKRLVDLNVSVSGRGSIVEDVGIHGISASPPWRNGMYEFEENEMALLLDEGFKQVQDARWHIVLTHVPPQYGKLDRTRFFQHAGSSALRRFVDEKQPALVVCGHIHEARGVEMIGDTTVVNCGPAASGYYAMIELTDQLKVDLRHY